MDCAVPYGRVRMSHECETLFATTLVSAFCVLITPPFDFIFVLLEVVQVQQEVVKVLLDAELHPVGGDLGLVVRVDQVCC